jgi:hypothetical protein
MREEGEDDMSSLLLGVGSGLMNFEFKETFTDAFEVHPLDSRTSHLLSYKEKRAVIVHATSSLLGSLGGA